MEKLQARNRELFDEMSKIKQELGMKVSMHESKLAEFNKLQLQYSELSKKEESDLKRMKEQISEKDSLLKQKKHEYELEKNKLIYQNDRLQEEIKRMKQEIGEF